MNRDTDSTITALRNLKKIPPRPSQFYQDLKDNQVMPPSPSKLRNGYHTQI